MVTKSNQCLRLSTTTPNSPYASPTRHRPPQPCCRHCHRRRLARRSRERRGAINCAAQCATTPCTHWQYYHFSLFPPLCIGMFWERSLRALLFGIAKQKNQEIVHRNWPVCLFLSSSSSNRTQLMPQKKEPPSQTHANVEIEEPEKLAILFACVRLVLCASAST